MSEQPAPDVDSLTLEQMGVVARGRLLLSILSQQAAAARAEAKCAQLKMLLADASNGNTEVLSRWLHEHDRQILRADCEAEPQAMDLSRASPVKQSEQLEGARAIESWDSLLPQARWRVGIREKLLKAGIGGDDFRLWLPSRSDEFHRPSSSEGPPAARAIEDDSLLGKLTGPGDGAGIPHLPSRAGTKNLSPADRRPAGLAKSFSLERPDKPREKHRKFLCSRRGGLTASAVFHFLLVLLLAIIHLKLPTPPASLALEFSTSDPSTETFELSEEVDMSVPEEKFETSLQTARFDLPENLSELPSAVSHSLRDLSVIANPPAAAALDVASSAQLNPRHSSASFFGAAASGNCFCYVIDGSGSMRDGPWEAAKLELLKSLASLTEKQRFYIIFYNRELCAIPQPGGREPAPHALYANKENLESARRWIDTLRIGIGAPPNAALEMAIEQEPDAIYLLTDGVTKADVALFLREKNRVNDLVFGEQVRIAIHTIAFYSLEGQQLLKQIAAENNGQFVYVPPPRKR